MLRPVQASDVIVVGGGVIGCAVTHALLAEGLHVGLVERDVLGAHASSAAAGMLAPLAESGGEGPLFELGLPALEGFPARVEALRESSGIDPGLVLDGLVRLRDKQSPATLPARLRELAVEAWDALDLRRHVPGLGADLETALYSPREGSVDPVALTRAYAEAVSRAGARIETGNPVLDLLWSGDRVTGVRTRQGDRASGAVVWCTGAWAGRALGALPGLGVEPVKGQMLAVRPTRPRAGPILWADAVYLVPRPSGQVRVGATVERVGFDASPTLGGVLALARAAASVLPELAGSRFDSTWAGLRPGTRDGLPLVGPHPAREGLLVAVGHDRNGILLSERTGRWVADMLLRPGRPAPEWSLLDPSRFARVEAGSGAAT